MLGRRARAAGVSLTDQVRLELVTLANQRVPIDSVVRALENVVKQGVRPDVDDDAITLVQVYGLPADALTVWDRRASAAGLSLSEYVLHELVVMARRTTVDDVILEFQEAQAADPSMAIDMDAVVDSVRYARAQ
ncbi:hypothetical protein CH260_04715 [Rhodococcus sp. 05-2256-B2]|nr:hypothetical protein A2J02_26560 [Rhodococcus sp. EPR-147]KZF03598.1 hypothetical protein A2J04_26670 [Rhodococcus sp. EPR-279]OZD85374.1 hypothetical protein CH258_14305 [Rhodococcus sp. 05-2256-B4]OZD99253.1 hypothetical protein CH257_00325 [Rhodococcus sp. 05-2256-B3]OZE00631.1 hypothetical protein CH260_04715 [Rhodococcus sp. 05-2256-B2]OZE02778.1 hypothetical protein CH285_12440 [Rhodococcus sp. 05-2256-B1]